MPQKDLITRNPFYFPYPDIHFKEMNKMNLFFSLNLFFNIKENLRAHVYLWLLEDRTYIIIANSSSRSILHSDPR